MLLQRSVVRTVKLAPNRSSRSSFPACNFQAWPDRETLRHQSRLHDARSTHLLLKMHQSSSWVLLSAIYAFTVAAAGSLPRGVGPECEICHRDPDKQPLEVQLLTA